MENQAPRQTQPSEVAPSAPQPISPEPAHKGKIWKIIGIILGSVVVIVSLLTWYSMNKTYNEKMKVTGAWVAVGTAGFSEGRAIFPSLALDSNNTPYVAYQDGANDGKATVMKYDGANWVNVGTAGFSAGGAPFPSLALDSNNTPYVAYSDKANGEKVTVMKYDEGK